MPSIVGNLKINTIGSSGILNVGDSFYVSPKSTSKAFAGSGSFTTGDFQKTINPVSATNTAEPDVLDSISQVLNFRNFYMKECLLCLLLF